MPRTKPKPARRVPSVPPPTPRETSDARINLRMTRREADAARIAATRDGHPHLSSWIRSVIAMHAEG